MTTTSRRKTSAGKGAAKRPGRRQMITLDDETIDRAVRQAAASSRSLSGYLSYIIRKKLGTAS